MTSDLDPYAFSPQTPIDALTASIDALDPTSTIHTLNQSQAHQLPPSPTLPPFQSPLSSLPHVDHLPDPLENYHHDPPIRLLFLATEIVGELHSALEQICANSVRNNMNMLPLNPPHYDPEEPPPVALNRHINRSRLHRNLRSPNSRRFKTLRQPLNIPDSLLNDPNLDLQPEFWWFVQFTQNPQLSQHEFSIATSHDNFIQLANTSPTHLVDLVDSHGRPDPSAQLTRFLITVTYKRKCEAFRALGHILGLTRHYTVHLAHPAPHPQPPLRTAHEEWDPEACMQMVGRLNRRQELANFDSLGIMIDCSRNGVLNVERVKELLRSIALMGLNVLQLYTEDTYEIKNEPFFGYFRGPYKQVELKEIDDYADALGIEVVACIQTLGHLGQMLQWPRYGAMRDTHEVLLVGSEEVYEFIEKMIESITTPLRSKRIHIGMDEAHGVSEGRYRQLFGHKDSSHVFTDHLNRVNQICTKLALKPMIWSDMLFCLAAKNNSLGGYYDSSNPATPELVQSIPPEIELVYWDYYHTTPGPYINKINQHRDLNFKSPAMASGIWTWSRFWTALPFTIETVRASMKAIKNPRSGVRHALTTIWGDEGNECDIWSALPGILYYAEHAYTLKEEVDVGLLKRKFDGICGGSFDDFVFASKLDDLQPENQLIDDKARFTPNLSKWLIWEEPFFSILSPQYAGHDLETHYQQLSAYLDLATSQEPMILHPHVPPQSLVDLPLNGRLVLPMLLAKVLALKCHLRDRLVQAYRQKDVEELTALAGPGEASRMSRLRALVDQVWRYHREMWMSMYKPFGWEVLDLRYGGLRARLETMHDRLVAYLDVNNRSVVEIEELEVDTEVVYPTSGAVMMLDYHRVSRPQYC